MLKKRIKAIVLFSVLCALSVSELSATGIGGFVAGSLARGSGYKDEKDWPGLLGPDNDLDKHETSTYKKLRFGLILDSNPDPGKNNFRFTASFGLGEVEKDTRRTEHFSDGTSEDTYSNKTYKVLEYYSLTGCANISIVSTDSFNFSLGPQFTVSYSTEKKVSYRDFCFGPGVSTGVRYFVTERVYCTADLGLNALWSINSDIDNYYGEVTFMFGLAARL